MREHQPPADPSSSTDVVVRSWSPFGDDLLDSSVWIQRPPHVRILWITLLTLASEPGRRGIVDMAPLVLASRANLSVKETEDALAALMEPDPDNRYQEEGGRRLMKADPSRPWAWRVMQWEQTQRTRSLAGSRFRVAKHRALKRAAVTPSAPERK